MFVAVFWALIAPCCLTATTRRGNQATYKCLGQMPLMESLVGGSLPSEPICAQHVSIRVQKEIVFSMFKHLSVLLAFRKFRKTS